MNLKRTKLPLLAKIIVAIVLGVVFGNVFNETLVRTFLTFNGIFSQFLGFMIPLIIVGLVTPAIADIGNGAGKLLVVTVALAFGDTILAGLLAYGTGSFRLSAGTRHFHRDFNFTELLAETVWRSLRHSCRSELTRQGISLP